MQSNNYSTATNFRAAISNVWNKQLRGSYVYLQQGHGLIQAMLGARTGGRKRCCKGLGL
jgi:hypothetical protein